jgi:hypothetical protein
VFNFQSKFLQKPTAATTIMPDAPTGDAASPTTNNHLKSRLLLERHAKKIANKPQNRTLAAGMPRL